MAEEIRTGGTKKFVRGNESPELEPELAKKIDQGYKKAEERKRRERRKKIIKWSIIGILIILIIISLLLYL